jgi:eukaryotic-like serine/threonine-protein kinase
VLQMIRRLPTQAPVRQADGDDDVLRYTASAANEAIDALGLPAGSQAAAIERVAQRYGRALNITAKDVNDALQASASAQGVASEEPAEVESKA